MALYLSSRKVLINALAAAVTLVMASESHALKTLSLVEGESAFVEISSTDLNLVKLSSPGVKPYTGDQSIEAKVVGSNVFVGWPPGANPKPAEIFFVTSTGTFSLIMVPKSIPGETIILRTPEEGITDAIEWEKANDYVTGLKELIKGMYRGIPPRGFAVTEVKQASDKKGALQDTLLTIYVGASITGEEHSVKNISGEVIYFGKPAEERRYAEQVFAAPGILAVSIDKHELAPGEETKVYLVRKNSEKSKVNMPFQRSTAQYDR
jgi:conjugal transfer pilus assembly protein TraK